MLVAPIPGENSLRLEEGLEPLYECGTLAAEDRKRLMMTEQHHPLLGVEP
jgi:hypothetical protein